MPPMSRGRTTSRLGTNFLPKSANGSFLIEREHYADCRFKNGGSRYSGRSGVRARGLARFGSKPTAYSSAFLAFEALNQICSHSYTLRGSRAISSFLGTQ